MKAVTGVDPQAGAALGVTVLREVTLQLQPLRLQRPESSAMQAGAAQYVADRVPAAMQAILDERYQQGFELGREEGARAAREALSAQQQSSGYEQGRQQGEAEGKRAAAAQFERGLARVDALLRALPAQLEARLAAAEDDMTALCFEAIGKIAGQGAIRTAAIRHVLQEGVAQLRAGAPVALHLHPDDLAALQAEPASKAWLAGFEDGAAPRLVGDKTVRLGGALLRSPNGSLDARLETQLQSLKTMLLQTRKDEQVRRSGAAGDAGRKGARPDVATVHATAVKGDAA